MNEITQELPVLARLRLRPAEMADIPEINALMALATRTLNMPEYDPEQVEALVQYFIGTDPEIIRDGTYYVVTAGDRIVGCGGWSRYEAMHNNTHPLQESAHHLIDPARGAAKIRLMYVHPDFARRGIASLILQNNISAAVFAGYTRLELVATFTGVPLYERFGFEAVETINFTLANDVTLSGMKMELVLA